MTHDEVSRACESGFLGRLPSDIVGRLLEGAQVVDHPTHSITFRPEDGERVAVVISGLMRVYLASPDRRQITLRYVRRGDLIVSPAGADRLSGGSEALMPTRLFHVDPAALRRLAERDPRFALAMLDELSHSLLVMYRALALRAFARVRIRVAQDILERAITGRNLVRGTVVRVTHQELAEATGSVREVVARAIRELQEDGLLSVERGGVVVRNPDALEVEALQLQGRAGIDRVPRARSDS